MSRPPNTPETDLEAVLLLLTDLAHDNAAVTGPEDWEEYRYYDVQGRARNGRWTGAAYGRSVLEAARSYAAWKAQRARANAVWDAKRDALLASRNAAKV